MDALSPPDFAKLIDELNDARGRYESAKIEESTARGNATTALNRLNAAQRAVDGAIEQVKKQAPRDSDWQRREAERTRQPTKVAS